MMGALKHDCVVPEKIYPAPPPIEGNKNSGGVGDLNGKKFKGKFEAKYCDFQKGRGV